MAKENFSIMPLGDRIVVKPTNKDDMSKSPSGIIIPDSASKEKPVRGTVVAVGPGKFENGAREPMTVNDGDIVLFSKYGFDEVKIDNEEYYILSESNVLGIIPKK